LCAAAGLRRDVDFLLDKSLGFGGGIAVVGQAFAFNPDRCYAALMLIAREVVADQLVATCATG